MSGSLKMGKLFSARRTTSYLLSFQGYPSILGAVRLFYIATQDSSNPALERSDGLAPGNGHDAASVAASGNGRETHGAKGRSSSPAPRSKAKTDGEDDESTDPRRLRPEKRN